MFKRVTFIASLLFCISHSANAATLNAYIKYFSTANACTYTVFNFQDSSKYTGSNNGTLKDQWYFSDGTTDTGKSVSKYFTANGTYTISLVVTNATDGLKDSVTKSVTINGTGVLPSFSESGPLCERSEPFFTLTSSTSAVIGYTVDFGDGTTPLSIHGTSSIGNHTFANRGTYLIKIRDSTSSGCKSNISQSIVIEARPFARRPDPGKPHCQGPDSGWTFKVTQQSTSDTAGMRVTYMWKFPDKSTYVGQVVKNKIFLDSGTITAELYAINHVGNCSDSTSFTFEVYSNPIVNFHLVPVCQDSIATIYDSTTAKFSPNGLYSWKWTFCDSNHSNCDTSNGYTGLYQPISISKGFPHGGTFYVTEYVKTYEGCADSLQKKVYINPIPTTDFKFKNTCVDSAVQFTDASTVPAGNSIAGWKWNFGDTTYLYTQTPEHQYKRAGYNYQVKLISKTQAGCIDSITKRVIAYPLPETGYSFISKCVNIQAPFSSSSKMPTYASDSGDYISHYRWIYGDGKFDSAQSTLHAFKDSGYHNVKLVAYSKYGCTDTSTQKVYIYPLPVPAFSLIGDCERDSVILFNTSKTSYGSSLGDSSYSWSYGDTSPVVHNISNPKHYYHYPGTYKVTLTAVNSNQCSKDTTISITIIPGPHSSFTVSPQCTGEAITFTNTTTDKSAGTLKYLWNMGDNTTDKSKNPVHTYNLSKNYRVRLTTTNTTTGCADSTPLQLVSVTPRPIAHFIAKNTCADTAVSFLDSSYVPGFPNTLQSESFDFGDGSFGSGPVTSHQYTSPGVYTVKEYVTSNSQCQDSFIKKVTVYLVPAADFSYKISCAGTPTPFTDQTPKVDSVVSWSWFFSNNIDTSTVQNPSHIFNDFDVLNASMTVTTNHGCANTKYANIIILQSPVPSISIPTLNCNQRAYQFYGFNNNSQVFNPTFQWNFGDAADPTTDTSYQINPSHTYQNAGNYWVTLKETSSQGCTNTDSQIVNVLQLPIPGFSYFGNCLGQLYLFADTSQLAVNRDHASWLYGDGGSDLGQSVSHQYTAPGTYQVKMVELVGVNGNIYCTSDTAITNVVVNPLPTPNFVWDTTCFHAPFLLTDSSQSNGGTITNYQWDFGDGTVDSVFTHPTYYHAFLDSFKGSDTSYRVILKVTTSYGCSNADTQHIVIRQIPYASFSANPNPAVIQHPQVTFTNTTIHADTTHYYWTFGDSTDSHEISPTHTYRDTGTYLVTLSADNDYCVDTFRYLVYVTPGYTIYAPNCITVNGDGKNDVWMAKGVGVIDYDVIIVDRWGQVVFHSTDINKPWNADYNGNGVKVPEGVYVYSIKAGDFSNTNFTSLKGNITVVR